MPVLLGSLWLELLLLRGKGVQLILNKKKKKRCVGEKRQEMHTLGLFQNLLPLLKIYSACDVNYRFLVLAVNLGTQSQCRRTEVG
ncbi:PREDICTED: uncharacterized protein LOC105145174 isoform X2 [Acromyrmex echinatior]|uniref:uncharacterized protein LOC105145174 isoform X2 n=1 Tax=Acromyrmex echinatior TaxID=103372 RepID=UPI00058102E9|nr:PREDICTED: uncharacterized protein LOC105145174 isoform X2 [Acromyrmex echinatior]